ncbi:MAG TPA: hypothetical protein VMK05_06610 [Burkholderiales bacterium]|nr:hypothetical protein [Burkholderiales bacterium]
MALVFPKEVRQFSDDEKKHTDAIKDVAEDLHNLIDMVPGSREREIAKTRLEEAVMWAIRAIARSM